MGKIANRQSLAFSERVRCFFAPPFMRNRRNQFLVISIGFPQILVDFQSISFDFLSFSISFSQPQSALINFNQFQSVWVSEKRRNLLTTGRWVKQRKTRSTLASHSAISCGMNVKRTNANRAIRIGTTNARSVKTNSCVFRGDMTANER